MLKEKIIEYANILGLIVGFADYSKYERLNNSRFNKKFNYARSIISVAYPISKSDKYNLASFALDKDYHIVLKEKLELLRQFILSNVKAEIEYFCDDGPVNDKLCAYLGGIGYYGKNSLIITKEYGSYIVLGELILDIEFDYDKLVEMDCGNCNMCELMCPANAMDDIHLKCISGLLQRKDVNEEDYELYKNIYGCDICQMICKKNGKIVANDEYVYDNINIKDIIRCSKSDFIKYKDTAFYWLGHNLMKRNAVIYAANNGIDITEELKFINSKEEYMLKAIDYYLKIGDKK